MADSPSDKLAAAEFANAPILGPGYNYASVTDKISAIVLTRRTPNGGSSAFWSPSPWSCCSWCRSPISSLMAWASGAFTIPIGWGFAIINFVWWIGIGHAGTLISAILLLVAAAVAHFHQPLCGSDDAVCRFLRGTISAAPHGPSVAGLLALPVSRHDEAVAAISAARWCGTRSRFRPTRRCRCCSGSSA